MKRAVLFSIAAMFALSALADEPKKTDTAPAYNTIREFKNRIFEVHNRSPRDIVSSVSLLGSGFQGAGISVNEQMKTITVRDFAENVAAIEEAIKRLDQPAPPEPDIELHIYVLIGSNAPAGSADLPGELADVSTQLQSTLRFKNYALMTSAVHHTHPGSGIESSGVAEPKLLGIAPQEGKPLFYDYSLTDITVRSVSGHDTTDIRSFRFSVRLPIAMGATTQYQNIGFNTPVTIGEGEKVVVGTSSTGDKALVVVVTTTIRRPAR